MTKDAPPVASRVTWIDSARGIGIVLVVIGHALGGLIDSPLGATVAPGYRIAFVAIYTFHMPLFFMLAGLMVQDRLARDRRGFLRGMGRTLVWPYFLWSVAQLLLIAALGDLVNRPITNYWWPLIALPWRPVSQFWFLHSLFLLHLAAFVGLPRLGARTLLIAALALKPLTALVALPDALAYAALEAPYYALGVYLGVSGVGEVIVGRGSVPRLVILPAIAGLLIVMVVIAAPALAPPIALERTGAAGLARLAWNPAALPAALAGMFAIAGLAASFPDGRLTRGIATLGRWSMPIFVLHVMAIAGTRILCISILHLSDPGVVLGVSTLMGLTLPAIAFVILRRAGLARPLGLA